MTDIEYLKKYGKKEEFESNIKRLEKGEPVQYIVGNVDFYGNLFSVNSNVLIPRFETEGLVERTIYYLKKLGLEQTSLVDIGTGSGCIAITLKKELPDLNVSASDISSLALDVAKENAKLNQVEITFYEGNLFEPLSEKYGCIVSNPPYIAKGEEVEKVVLENEPHLALFAEEDGLYYYHEILKTAGSYLNEHYLLAFEIGMTQRKYLENLAKRYFPRATIIFEKDLSGKDRYFFLYE